MLKKRIAATLVVKDGTVVQSLGFARYMPVGRPEIAAEFLDDWGVDEIILLDIDATRNMRQPDYDMIRSVATRCHVPLTVGGGISTIENISKLLHCGADKVSLNQAALRNPALLSEAAKQFGAQCVIASVDALLADGGLMVYDYLYRKALPISAVEFASQLQERGAGEILITSVDRDGAKCGFDLYLVNRVCAAVTVPVICCGGAGNPQHFIEVLTGTRVNAASAANFFHFTEHSVSTTKALVNRHLSVRHETHAKYSSSQFDCAGRLLKKSEQYLEDLLYQRVEKEII